MANTGFTSILTKRPLTLAETYSKVRALFHYPVIGFLALMLHTKYRMKVYGRELLPNDETSYVIVSTHSSLLDPPIVSATMRYRPIAFMAKEELFQKPLMSWFCLMMGTFPVNREKVEKRTILTAKAVLKTGFWYLGVFPEGTRTKPGQVAPLKKGAAFIAQSSGVGVIPMVVLRHGPNDKHILVQIGAPIPYDRTRTVDDLSSLIRVQLQALVVQAETRLSGTH
jgi:1-acyl-sn-glycerol-3-phosphate acyltransferase